MHARENGSLVDWLFTVAMENVVDTPSELYGAQGWLENSLIEADKGKMVCEGNNKGKRILRAKI